MSIFEYGYLEIWDMMCVLFILSNRVVHQCKVHFIVLLYMYTSTLYSTLLLFIYDSIRIL